MESLHHSTSSYGTFREVRRSNNDPTKRRITPKSLTVLNDELPTSSAQEKSQSILKGVFLVGLLRMLNIVSWYWTNGMNGISMQTYASELKNDPSMQTSEMIRLIFTLITTTSITSVQLLAGSLIGRFLLLILNRRIKWSQVIATHWLPLSTLHGMGSLATNLGFMYGKASVIQIIKLLEPFETLGLSLLFFHEGNASIGVVSSMVMVVGAAMSLLKIQSTKTPPLAIVFAVISGLALSTRNVLQRKHHKTTNEIQELTKLERSIVQFTQLSFFSGLGTGLLSIVLYGMVSFGGTEFSILVVQPSAGLILWHPMYTVFSMTTLGFSTALTHSLLNAGKRVFSIVLSVVWFKEGFNAKLLAGLCLVMIGGFWYSYESKQKDKPEKIQYHKLALSLAALSVLAWFYRS